MYAYILRLSIVDIVEYIKRFARWIEKQENISIGQKPMQ